MSMLDISNFNIVCAVIGGFIALFGLVAYLAKERFDLSEACKLRCFDLLWTEKMFTSSK